MQFLRRASGRRPSDTAGASTSSTIFRFASTAPGTPHTAAGITPSSTTPPSRRARPAPAPSRRTTGNSTSSAGDDLQPTAAAASHAPDATRRPRTAAANPAADQRHQQQCSPARGRACSPIPPTQTYTGTVRAYHHRRDPRTAPGSTAPAKAWTA